MKHLILMLLAAALLLSACGKQEKTEPPPGETVLEPTCAETISETGITPSSASGRSMPLMWSA